jgi:hypothetical protein
MYYCSTHSIVSMPKRGHCVCVTVLLLHGQFLQQQGQPRDNFAGWGYNFERIWHLQNVGKKNLG